LKPVASFGRASAESVSAAAPGSSRQLSRHIVRRAPRLFFHLKVAVRSEVTAGGVAVSVAEGLAVGRALSRAAPEAGSKALAPPAPTMARTMIVRRTGIRL
jgi:hypothetical protein